MSVAFVLMIIPLHELLKATASIFQGESPDLKAQWIYFFVKKREKQFSPNQIWTE